MRRAGIRAGDVVRCRVRGYPFWALVDARDPAGLEVSPLNRGVSFRRVRARQVLAHYRRSRESLE